MEDKEVGKSWAGTLPCLAEANGKCLTCLQTQALIRKLVEERTSRLRTSHLDDSHTHHLRCEKCHWDYSEWIKLALDDFGIHPKTWSEK